MLVDCRDRRGCMAVVGALGKGEQLYGGEREGRLTHRESRLLCLLGLVFLDAAIGSTCHGVVEDEAHDRRKVVIVT